MNKVVTQELETCVVISIGKVIAMCGVNVIKFVVYAYYCNPTLLVKSEIKINFKKLFRYCTFFLLDFP